MKSHLVPFGSVAFVLVALVINVEMESETEHMALKSNEMKENLKKKLMEPTVLDNFSKLTSDVEKIRVTAGVTLLKHLNSIDDLDKKQNEYAYALNRLVKGVGATQYNAKTGFYTVLVALLTKSPLITVEHVLEAVKKHLSTASSKSEDANISMGQILVCGALVHSGKYDEGTREEQGQILEMLITAGKKRSYLSLASCTFLVELIEKVDEKQFKSIWEVIKPLVSIPWKDQTLDTVYLLLKAKNKFPNTVTNKYILKVLDSSDIVHSDSIKPLCEILMHVPTVISVKHPLYPEIAKLIVKKSLQKQFFSELDKLLLKSNRIKQLIITNLLMLVLENVSDYSVIPHMLTKNYIEFTIHYFKHAHPYERDEEYFVKMNMFFKILIKKLQEETVESKTKIAVIKKLIFYPGTFIFEKITKTKVIQQITIGLDDTGVKKLSNLYKEVVLASKPKMINATESENWINMDRVYAAQLIVKLLSHSSLQKNTEWRLEQLKFFLTTSLFKDSDNSFIGNELATSLKDCFYHALDQKLPKLEDLRNILSSLVHFINQSVFKSSTKLRNPVTEEVTASWAEMMQLIIKLEGNQKLKHSYAIPVFHTLVLHMGLQLFIDTELAQNALKELQSCFTRLQTEKSPKKRKLKEGELEEDEPVWIEVVVDLFLSLLSHNSHLMRSIIGCVFPYLCPHLTLTALRQILDILDPKNEHNPLSKEEGESDLSDEETTDDEADEENGDNDDDEQSGLEEDDAEVEESATDRMRMAVRQALHKTGYQTDDESEDIDNLDEEEGKKLDAALAEAFKMVKKNSKGRNSKQNKDDKTLTHFRVRVLDLIETYLDSEPVMLNCLEIACLLLQTLEFSIRDVHQKPLEHRVRSCLKKLPQIKKFSSTEDTTEEILATMLKSFLDKGSKSAFIYQDMGDIIAECCIFAIRCSQILISENTETPKKSKKKQPVCKIAEIFKESLETFFLKRDCLLPILLFKSVLQITWDGNWALVPQLVNFSFNIDIRPFRRSQALELLRIFYCNSRFRTANVDNFKKNISPLEKNISDNTIELLHNISTNPKNCKVKEKFVCLLLNLLTAIKSANSSDQMNWSKIGESVRSYRSNVTLAKDAKMAYNKLCRALGISNIVKMQLKTVENGQKDRESSDESEVEKASQTSEDKRSEKKRKKASAMKKDKQKAKKEARLLRMKASSEGLGDFAFSSVALPDVIDEKYISDSEEPKNKKSKKKMKTETYQNGDGDVTSDSDEEQQQKSKRKPKSKNNQLNGKTNSPKTKKRHSSESGDRPIKKKKNSL